MRDGDRQVIYLRFFLDLSLEEVGDALSLPVGTVKSRLSRALARLRETVQRDHPAMTQVLEE
jgi:RNA polymerase sigma-70 factor (ECF subfamily)